MMISQADFTVTERRRGTLHRHIKFLVTGFIGCLIASNPTFAHNAMEDSKTDCATTKVALPEYMKSWSNPLPSAFAQKNDDLGKNFIPIGKTVKGDLYSKGSVQFVDRPEEPGGSISYAGMLPFKIEKEGTYRVIIGEHAWIEIVQNHQFIKSSHHQRGPACVNVGKMVDFPLKAGNYVLELSASGKQVMKVLIVPVP